MQTDKHTRRQIDRQAYRWIGGQNGRLTDRLINGQTDRQTGR